MDGIDIEPIPGTTLKTLVHEYEILNEFVALLKKRIEVEAEYITKLREVQGLAHPTWSQSKIWPLLSPLLAFFDKEIEHREAAKTALSTAFEALPRLKSPNEPNRDGTTPLFNYETLSPSYLDCYKNRKAVSSETSINKLKDWYEQARSLRTQFFSGHNIASFIIPEIDRIYRQSVCHQRKITRTCRRWHRDELPVKLEEHQQRAEDVKVLIDQVLLSYSSLALKYSRSSSTAQNTLADFSPSRFIAANADRQFAESSHALLMPVQYLNFAIGGVPSEPLFGVPSRVGALGDALVDAFPTSTFLERLDISIPFELEQRCGQFGDLPVLAKQASLNDRMAYLAFAFASSPPLIPDQIPLQPTASQSSLRTMDSSSSSGQFIGGIARETIPYLLDPLPKVQKFALGMMMSHAQNMSWQTAHLFTHRREGIKLAADIWRKWDWENDGPLPKGVIRIIKNDKPTLILKRNGATYIPDVTKI